MGKIKNVTRLNATSGSRQRKKVIQLRENIDIDFELREICHFSAAATSAEAQFDGLIVEMGAKVGQYEKQYSEKAPINMSSMRIDAHQHYWDLSRLDYPWMPPEPSVLRQTCLPGELEPILANRQFDGSVVVQANVVIEETWWLLDLASRHESIRGVVAWVDLTDPKIGRAHV